MAIISNILYLVLMYETVTLLRLIQVYVYDFG